MFNSVALDVVIGLVFIYLLYSLLVSIVQEIIATNLGFRAKILEKSIIRMLEDEHIPQPDGNIFIRSIQPYIERIGGYLKMFLSRDNIKTKEFAKAFYNHPLIKYMAEDKYFNKPSYITAENFSKVMVDLLHGVSHDGEPLDINKIKEAVNEGKLLYNNMLTTQYQTSTNGFTIINEDTRLMLASLLQEARGDIDVFESKLEQWFNDTQNRASGWYKKYTQVILFCIGLCISIGFNVDTIAIVKKLSKDPQLRSEMVQSAIAFSEKNSDLNNRIQAMHQAHLDSTTEYKNLKVLADTLYNKNLRLLQDADSLVKNDIQSANNLLGLGWNVRWDSIGWKKDSVRWFNKGTSNFTGFYGVGLVDMKNNCSTSSFIGWFLTALALSLGAPFWFDMLNKLIKLRGAKKEEGGSSISNANSDVVTDSPSISPINVTINNRQAEEEAVG